MKINRKTERVVTKSLIDEDRTPSICGWLFDECEHCKTEYSDELNWLAMRYYHRYSMVLCDRCIDKLNSIHNGQHIDEYWTDEDAKKDGLTKFPRKDLPKYNYQNQLEYSNYMREKREKSHATKDKQIIKEEI